MGGYWPGGLGHAPVGGGAPAAGGGYWPGNPG